MYEKRLVEVRMTVGGTTIVLEDIPQGVCPECESRVYKAAMLETIEAVMRGRAPAPPRSRI